MLKNLFNFFNGKAEYNSVKNELSPDSISFVAEEHRIYAKNNWFGGAGEGAGSSSIELIENAYDDTEVRGLITSLQEELTNLTLLTQEDVATMISDATESARNFVNNFGWDAMFEDSGWAQQMNAFIQNAGFTDGNNNSVSWSQFYQDFKGVQAAVNELQLGGNDNEITVETIQALINAGIENSSAIASLQSKWALSDENERMLRWLSAGMTSSAMQYGSFSSMYAAQNRSVDEAISSVNSSLQNTNDAIAALTVRIQNDETNTGNNTSAIATLSARIDQATSGFITQAELNNTSASLFSEIDDIKAVIQTTVKKDANGNVTSSIKFGADNVELNEDGSGMISGGALRWTDDGEFYLGDYLRLDTTGMYSGDNTIEINFERNDIYSEFMHADSIGGETLNLWADIVICKHDPYYLYGQDAVDNKLATLHIDDYGKIALQKEVYNGTYYDSVDDSKFILNLATGELSVDHIIADGGASTFDSVSASSVSAGRITTSNFYTAGNPARFEDGAVFEDDIVAEDVQCENLEVTSLKVPSTSGAVTVGSATGYTGDVDFVDTQGIHKMAYFRNGILTGIGTIIASGSFEEGGDPDSF